MFAIGDRFRLIAQPFDITSVAVNIGDEGEVIGEVTNTPVYQYQVRMDNGKTWFLQAQVMASTVPPLVNDISKVLGL